jgi:DNA-binding HxlR family transcriptional regulator
LKCVTYPKENAVPTQTAAQQRADARRAFESFLAECPSRDLLETIGSKWVTLTLAALGPGTQRYNALQRRIAGISPKMLTQTLRTLERDGLVSRTVTASVPVQVDYRLTPLGEQLLTIVLTVKAWAEANIEAIQHARSVYDARGSDD